MNHFSVGKPLMSWAVAISFSTVASIWRGTNEREGVE